MNGYLQHMRNEILEQAKDIAETVSENTKIAGTLHYGNLEKYWTRVGSISSTCMQTR